MPTHSSTWRPCLLQQGSHEANAALNEARAAYELKGHVLGVARVERVRDELVAGLEG